MWKLPPRHHSSPPSATATVKVFAPAVCSHVAIQHIVGWPPMIPYILISCHELKGQLNLGHQATSRVIDHICSKQVCNYWFSPYYSLADVYSAAVCSGFASPAMLNFAAPRLSLNFSSFFSLFHFFGLIKCSLSSSVFIRTWGSLLLWAQSDVWFFHVFPPCTINWSLASQFQPSASVLRVCGGAGWTGGPLNYTVRIVIFEWWI